MKKIIICLLITAMGYTVNAQRFNRFESDWKVSVGVNAVGSAGTRNPVEKLSEFAFQFPIAVALEHQWSEDFAIEQDITLNGFKPGKFTDFGIASEKLTYFSTNTTFKWYFSDYLFNLDELDLHVGGGVGVFYLDDLNTSFNLSGGVQYWFSENVAVRLQTTGKFATNVKNHRYANNHFQHLLQFVFRFN